MIASKKPFARFVAAFSMAVIPSKSKPVQVGVSALLSELIPALTFVRRWWLLAFCMVFLTSLTTLAIVVFGGVEYQVSASLFLKLGPELAPPPTMGNDPLVITRRPEDVNDEIEILTSPDLIHEVVTDLGEEFFRAPPPTTTFGMWKRSLKNTLTIVTDALDAALIQAGLRRPLTMLDKVELGISKKLKVELVRDSDIISLTLDTPSPEAGVTIVHRLLDAYHERHLAVHRELATKDILEREKNVLQEQLDESSARLLEFQLATDLWAPEDQQKLLLDNRKQLQQQVAAARGRVANLKQYVEVLARTAEDLPVEIELSRTQQLNPAIVNLEEKLSALGYSQAIVETTFRPNAREVVDRRQQMESLRNRIDDQEKLVPHSTSKGINVVRQDVQKELALKQAELKGLVDQLTLEERQLADANDSLKELGKAMAQYQRLHRDHHLMVQKLALYTESFQKADIATVMNSSRLSNMELISPPIASLEPVRPRLLLMAAGGVLSGLIFAFLLAIAFDLRTASRNSKTITPTV